MNFYFNIDLNKCASERWVVEYLFASGDYKCRGDALDELNSKNEVDGWFSCSVSENIEEACWTKFIKEKDYLYF